MSVVRNAFACHRPHPASCSACNRSGCSIVAGEDERAGIRSNILGNLSDAIAGLEDVYRDLHRHPEASMNENRTAKVAADHLKTQGFEVTMGVGETGVVGLLKNGNGRTVMLRADMDALPIEQQDDDDADHANASTSTPMAHACSHDMHVTWLIGVSTVFASHKDEWKGTLLVVFQPGEETAQGAQAMIDDRLFDRFPRPDVVLGQHVMVGPSGTVACSSGPITSAADSLQIRIFGRGVHGSMPQASIDPVIIACSTVLRLQTIVSREVASAESVVLTVGVVQAGSKENVIPDEAIIKLNVRTIDTMIRKRVLESIHRIVNAEATASGAEKMPEITPIDSYPLNVNDKDATGQVVEAFQGYFGNDKVFHTGPAPASEDFGCFGTEWKVPSVFWFVGGTDRDIYRKAKEEGKINELPVNHSPKFKPVLHPTLETGVEAMAVATLAWLRK